MTRTGSYAGHCDEMILPSYSTCKCIFAGFALMRLSQLYGPSVYSELIKDWLYGTVCARFPTVWLHFEGTLRACV